MRARVQIEGTVLPRKSYRPVRSLVKAVLAAEGRGGSITVAFVSESEITHINGSYRGSEGSTDVLSFREADSAVAWPDPTGAEKHDLGLVMICPAVVKRYGLEEDADRDTRLGWTVIHGVLHLLGYDHENDQGQMRAREQELLMRLDSEVRAVSKPGKDIAGC